MDAIKNIPVNFLICLLVLTVLTSCIEEYHPEVDSAAGHLVVEGLFTDIEGESYVKLRRSSMYGNPGGWKEETHASVYVEDDVGNVIVFEEQMPGIYLPHEDVVAESGRSYVLAIITANGDEYRSQAQKMPHNQRELLSFQTKPATKDFYIHSSVSSNVYRYDVGGAMLNLALDAADGSKYHLRFSSVLTAQYIIVHPGEVDDTYEYCWMHRHASDYMDARIGVMGEKHAPYLPVAFVPMHNRQLIHLGYPEGVYLNARIITLETFFVNPDTYHYYGQAEMQLGDDGRYFDPFAINPVTNLQNLTHPQQAPLGFFEASAMNRQLLNIRFDKEGIPSYFFLEDVDRIPAAGCSYEIIPDFWL